MMAITTGSPSPAVTHRSPSATKKRILHCAYSGLGGHAAVLFTLLETPLREEFDHFVLFFGVEDLCEDYARTCARLGTPFVFIRKSGRLALRAYAAVLKTIRQVRPDLIMVNGTPLAVPILLARPFFRGKWAVSVRESQANHLKTRLEWLGSYVSILSADAVIYLTDEHRTEVENRVEVATRRGRAWVIPNGVDADAHTRASRDDSSTIRLVMTSRLVSIKDHPTLIEAVRMLVFQRGYANLELSLAGDGPRRAELESRVRAAGLAGKVTFHGLLDTAAVIELLGCSDIYVHCTFGETMSNSILQAMASQLPVVASDVKGVSNLVRHGVDGLLVPVQDAGALADAIEELVRVPSARRKMGLKGRERAVGELSQRRMVEAYRGLMIQLSTR